MIVNTSDDVVAGLEGNCEVFTRAALGSGSRGDGTTDGSPATNVMADYVCRVYHTYDASGPTGEGWDGTINIYGASGTSCSIAGNTAVSTYTYTAGSPIIADTGDQTGAAGTLDFECSSSGLVGSDLVTTVALSSADSSPLEGSTVSFLVTAPPTENGIPATPITFTVGAAAGDQPDNTTAGDSLSVELIPTRTDNANLVTVKTRSSSDTSVNVGDTVVYDVKVTNLGGGNVANISLAETWPANLTFVSASISSDNAAVGTYTHPNWAGFNLNADETATLTLTGTANAAGAVTNTVNEASSASLTDPSDTDNVLSDSSVSVVAAGNADMLTSITVDSVVRSSGENISVNEDDMVTFEFTILNNGPALINVSNVQLNLFDGNLTGLTLLTAGSTSGIMTPNSSSGTNCTTGVNFGCTTGVWSPANLGVAASETLTLKARVDNAAIAASPIAIEIDGNTGTAGLNPPEGNKTDGLNTASDVLTVNINASAAAAVFTPGTINGTWYSDSAAQAGIVTGVTAELVNYSDQLSGVTGTCSTTDNGDNTGTYTCTFTSIDTSLYKGASLQWTASKNSGVGCYNAIVSGALQGHSNPPTATHWWIGSISAQTTTQDIWIYRDTSLPASCP